MSLPEIPTVQEVITSIYTMEKLQKVFQHIIKEKGNNGHGEDVLILMGAVNILSSILEYDEKEEQEEKEGKQVPPVPTTSIKRNVQGTPPR